MTVGPGPERPAGEDRDEDDRDEAGAAAWFRRFGLGLILAAILIVLLAGVVGDLLPGRGIIIGQPGPVPTITTPGGQPSSTAPPGTASAPPTSIGTGGATEPGGNNTQPPGGVPTSTTSKPTTKPTTKPTKPPKPPKPPKPFECRAGSKGRPPAKLPPNSTLVSRQQVFACVSAGRLTLLNTSGLEVATASATRVSLGLGNTLIGQSVVTGQIAPVTVTDARGGIEGWSLTGNVILPGGIPPSAIITIDPWCAPISPDAAPGLTSGPAGQSVRGPILMCDKDQSIGTSGSTGGRYNIGGTVSVYAWRGTPLPASLLILNLTMS